MLNFWQQYSVELHDRLYVKDSLPLQGPQHKYIGSNILVLVPYQFCSSNRGDSSKGSVSAITDVVVATILL